ncbi:MAG: hypothetical protein KBI44_06070 [Thermoanaerobaculia bacterium]|nr:hypothetical protein [Thermoanaerobaculia bacterium]
MLIAMNPSLVDSFGSTTWQFDRTGVFSSGARPRRAAHNLPGAAPATSMTRAAPPRDSAIVFRDLEHAFGKLRLAQANPAELRRALREFIGLTQQLTEICRHEFSQVTGKKWIPAQFPGWTPTSSLFKKLRRSDYHEHPFLVDVRHSQIIPFGKTDTGAELALKVESTAKIDDPNRERCPRPGMSIHLPKEDVWMRSIEDKTRYIFRGRTSEVRAALAAAGTDDVLDLAESCMGTLRGYYTYYCDRLDESLRPGK